MSFIKNLRAKAVKKAVKPLIKANPNSSAALVMQGKTATARTSPTIFSALTKNKSVAVQPILNKITAALPPKQATVPVMAPIVKPASMPIPAPAAMNLQQMQANVANNELPENLDPALLPTHDGPGIQTAGIGGNKIMIGLIGSAVLGYFLLGGKKENQTKGLSGVKSKRRSSTKRSVTASKKRSGRRMQVISL